MLAACSSDPKPDAEKEEPATPAELSLSDEQLVARYASFVAAIDSSKAESVTLAADKFREIFDQSSPEVCDQAYAHFEELYENVAASLDEQAWNDPQLSEVNCPNVDEEGNELPMDKNLRKFLAKVEPHGFRLQCLEGGVGITTDRKFVKAKFYSYVSAAMKSYLDQVQHEEERGFSHDAGIVISNTEFVDRTVFWEKFIAANPGFPLIEKARYTYKTYLTYLLIGMDNTPVFNESQGDGLLNFELAQDFDAYYEEAYTYLNEKFPKSETNKLVAPYLIAARSGDTAKINALLRKYLKQKKLLDFETEFGSE